MGWVSGAVLLPLLGAALHPLLGFCIQKGLGFGVGLGPIVCVANLITGLLFLAILTPGGGFALEGKDWWAIANGVLFFLGQWFSARSLKGGDLAVHSSALGFKVVIVGACSMLVGLEAESLQLVLGVLLAVFAVFLVSGGSLEGWKANRATVGYTLLACLFFGLNDFLTGWQSREIGAGRWLTLMMASSGLVSLGVLVQSRKQSLIVIRNSTVAFWVLGAGLLLGIQALLVNLAFSQYGQPTLSNVVYSSRGVMAVAFVYLIGQRSNGRLMQRQIAGSILMMAALIVVLLDS